MNCAIIVASGKSSRMGKNVDKAFLSLGSKPVVIYSLQAFEKCPDIDEVILVVRKDRVEAARYAVRMYGCTKVTKIIPGGNHRRDSVIKGLDEIDEDCAIVSVHDGVRPCVSSEIVTKTVRSAEKYGSGVAAVKVTDTVKEVKRGHNISKTIDRTKLWLVQTPQSFKFKILKKALEHVKKKRVMVTDEASAVEMVTKNVKLVPSTAFNIKITSPDDLVLASALMRL